MDAAIAAVLRQAAWPSVSPTAPRVERVACEARANDLAYLSGDDSDDSDDDAWEYAACPDAEQRFEASSRRSRTLHVVHVSRRGPRCRRHFAARAAVAFGAVGDRGAAAKVFLAKEAALYAGASGGRRASPL